MLYRGVLDEERFIAAAIVRITYDIVGSELKIAKDQIWPVSAPPWQCDYGPMESDEVFYRGGVDALIFGCARPDKKGATAMEVKVEVGPSFQYTLAIFGKRVWREEWKGLKTSPPEPIEEIPLTLAYAFGGKDRWDGLDVPFPENPDGLGYYLQKENAVEKPLPNIENPGCLIAKWDDKPEPVGVAACGLSFGPRVRRSTVFDETTGVLKELKPTFFNAAFPDMIVPKACPGDRVKIAGVLPGTTVEFAIPQSGLKLDLRFGEEKIAANLAVDQIGVEPDQKRAFVTWRYPFRYVFNPMQIRECKLGCG